MLPTWEVRKTNAGQTIEENQHMKKQMRRAGKNKYLKTICKKQMLPRQEVKKTNASQTSEENRRMKKQMRKAGKKKLLKHRWEKNL